MDNFLPETIFIDDTGEQISEEELIEISNTQENLNAILESVRKRVSEYALEFYIENIKNASTLDFWKEVLLEIISHYQISPLRFYLHDGYFDLENPSLNLKPAIINLLRFIKISLVNFYGKQEELLSKIDNSIDFMNFVSEHFKNIPYLFRYGMKYLDRESFLNFSKKLLIESKEDF